MTGYESVSELQEIEAECLKRFRAKAAEIRGAHPEMTASIAFARAVQALPKSADRYAYARQLLQMRGVAAMPLR